MLEPQEARHQEARGISLQMPEATYEEETKTGAGRHGDRQTSRRVQSLENAYRRGVAKREKAEMVRPSHDHVRGWERKRAQL